MFASANTVAVLDGMIRRRKCEKQVLVGREGVKLSIAVLEIQVSES